MFRIQTFTVTFKNGNLTLSTQQIDYGNYATAPTSPTKDGYTFLGWSMDGENIVEISGYAVTENITFTAVFEENRPSYFIEYDTLGNGSVLSVNFECVSTAKAGETVTFTLTLVDLSDRFDDYYPLEITGVSLRDSEGEYDYELSELNGNDGKMYTVGKKYYFSFTMPEDYTGEYVTVMVYLMRL